ncbi:MAG: transglutaminase-like domain-containing protein [Planctomycetaceae bacterium]
MLARTGTAVIGAVASSLALAGDDVRNDNRDADATESADGIIRHFDPVTCRIQHRATLTNGTCDLTSIELWLPVPQDGYGQKVTSLVTEPDRAKIQPDTTGTLNVARLQTASGLPAHNQSMDFAVSYQVTSSATVTDHSKVPQHSFDDYDVDEDYRRFTRAETKIEVRDEQIRTQANALKAIHSRPYDLARAAYDWVIDRTRYQLVNGLQGASSCLKEQCGECCDYSALFVAVCRAAGVPARPVIGFWGDEVDGWHVWAEFMIPGGTWIPVDPALGDQSPRSRRHYFGSLDNRRVALGRTFDVKLNRTRKEVEVLQLGAAFWQASVVGTAPATRYTVTGKRVDAQDR